MGIVFEVILWRIEGMWGMGLGWIKPGSNTKIDV